MVQLPSRRVSLHLSGGKVSKSAWGGNLVPSLLGLSGKTCIWESPLGLSYTSAFVQIFSTQNGLAY